MQNQNCNQAQIQLHFNYIAIFHDSNFKLQLLLLFTRWTAVCQAVAAAMAKEWRLWCVPAAQAVSLSVFLHYVFPTKQGPV
jgi:hypothetical protein